MPRAEWHSMQNITIYLPSCLEKKEQIAMGNFFKQLDDTLALQARQITLLENLKKAFLQKCFV